MDVLTKEEKEKLGVCNKYYRKCDHCGKEFYIPSGSSVIGGYAYTKKTKKGSKYYCSWTCYRA